MGKLRLRFILRMAMQNETQEQAPNNTLYVNNLNEKIKSQNCLEKNF